MKLSDFQMIDREKQPKLLGFAAHGDVVDEAALRIVIREELLRMREILGARMIAVSGAAPGADLIFLKNCVELRIPTVVILPSPKVHFQKHFKDAEEWKLAEGLMSVALEVYETPEAVEDRQLISRQMLDWADALLFAWDGMGGRTTGDMVQDARYMGIPARIIDAGSLIGRWEIEADRSRAARHGFADRKELLEFFDARFARG